MQWWGRRDRQCRRERGWLRGRRGRGMWWRLGSGLFLLLSSRGRGISWLRIRPGMGVSEWYDWWGRVRIGEGRRGEASGWGRTWFPVTPRTAIVFFSDMVIRLGRYFYSISWRRISKNAWMNESTGKDTPRYWINIFILYIPMNWPIKYGSETRSRCRSYSFASLCNVSHVKSSLIGGRGQK